MKALELKWRIQLELAKRLNRPAYGDKLEVDHKHQHEVFVVGYEAERGSKRLDGPVLDVEFTESKP